MFMGSKLPATALAQTHMLACKFMSCDVFSNSCNQIRLKSVAGIIAGSSNLLCNNKNCFKAFNLTHSVYRLTCI